MLINNRYSLQNKKVIMTHHYDTLFAYDYVQKSTSIILFIDTWMTKEYVPISSEIYPYKTIIYILIFSKNRVQMCVKLRFWK